MEEVQRTFETLNPGELVLSSTSDYVQVAYGEPLKAHISRVETTQDKKFESDELETKLVVGFTLDEKIEGEGQIYTAWLRPSLNPKSKMFKMLHAVYSGNIPNPLDPTDLLGQPLRLILTPAIEKNGKTRQYVESYLKPASDQARVEVEKVLTDVPDGEIDMMDVDKMFEA